MALTEKERRMYSRWKNYKLSDLTAKEQKMFGRWQREMEGTTTPHKKKTKHREYQIEKPPERKGFWNKVAGKIDPTIEEQRYSRRMKRDRLQEKLSTIKVERDIARAEASIKESKSRGRGGTHIMDSMMSTGHIKKKKHRRSNMDNLFSFK